MISQAQEFEELANLISPGRDSPPHPVSTSQRKACQGVPHSELLTLTWRPVKTMDRCGIATPESESPEPGPHRIYRLKTAKLISQAVRRKAEELIPSGRVTVNGWSREIGEARLIFRSTALR
jgi:hypothetical protein